MRWGGSVAGGDSSAPVTRVFEVTDDYSLYPALTPKPLETGIFFVHADGTGLRRAGVGEFDGNEIASDLSEGTLYMYGPDAEALFKVVQPILVGASCLRRASATLRFGPPKDGVPKRTETLRS